MKKLILVLFVLSNLSYINTQWVSNYGGTENDVNFFNARGNAVECDANGNSYITGYVSDPLTYNDIILIKYNSRGHCEWAVSYNGTESVNDEGKDLCIDANGNIFITGFHENARRSLDIAILKYSPDGILLWERSYRKSDSPVSDIGNAIALDNAGNIYVTGFAKNNEGLKDFVVIKYDQNGNLIWDRLVKVKSQIEAEGMDIAVSSSGYIYAAGYTKMSELNTDITVVKLNSNGTIEWTKTTGGENEDKAWGIVVDESDNIFITGYITTTDFPDCYTAKLNSNGTILWEDQYNGSGNHIDRAWGIVVDTDGAVYITGESTDANMNVNFITRKLSSAGAVRWTSFYDGPANRQDIATAIGIIANNENTKSVVVTGKSYGSDNNFDYATVRINSKNGVTSQVNRYSYSSVTNDMPNDLAVSNNKVVVTGVSQLIIESSVEQSYISTLMYDWGKESELVTGTNIPEKFALYQNYPNPFNPSTNIKFDIAVSGNVKLTIYDMLGKVAAILVNRHLAQGTYNISFKDMSLSSGIYFYELQADNYREIKKMTLVK